MNTNARLRSWQYRLRGSLREWHWPTKSRLWQNSLQKSQSMPQAGVPNKAARRPGARRGTIVNGFEASYTKPLSVSLSSCQVVLSPFFRFRHLRHSIGPIYHKSFSWRRSALGVSWGISPHGVHTCHLAQVIRHIQAQNICIIFAFPYSRRRVLPVRFCP